MKKKRIITIMLITIIALFTMTIVAKATINPDDFNPNNKIYENDVKKVTDLANPIIGTLKTLGVIVAVITLTILGIKYMAGSTQEKAEYKKTMIPYIIGAILTVSITQFLGVIIEIVTNIK